MTLNMQIDGRLFTALRITMWAVAAGLLLLPLVAMRFTTEVNWTGSDFVFAAVMLGAACGAMELGARASRSWAYLAGFVLAVAAWFLLIWVNAAVGFVGEGPNLPNLTICSVALLAIAGAALARLRPAGMARAMIVCAVAQAALGVVWRNADPRPVIVLSLVFAAVWLAAAGLFALAARRQAVEA